MQSWSDLFHASPTIGNGALTVTDGVQALSVLQAGTYLRFNLLSYAHVGGLSVRLRTREV